MTGIRSAYKVLAGAFFCLVAASTLNGQILPGGNVYIGYSYVHSNIVFGNGILRSSGSANLNGWDGSLELKLIPWIGGVADFGGNYGTQQVSLTCEAILPPCLPLSFNAKTNLHTFLFGPRASVSIGRFTPFAQALFGAAHLSANAHSAGFSTSDTSFSTALGAGMDYKLIKGIAWRLQGDYLQTRLFSGTQNNVRLSTGLVFRF